jgi:hypothetical protein
MAQIKSHGGHTEVQYRACRPGEPDTWLTLTVTSDGRLLRKVTVAHRSQWGTHYSNSNNKVIATVGRPELATVKHLARIAARMGYTEVKA